MVTERRTAWTAGTALVRLPRAARSLAVRPLARSVLARYLLLAAVLLAVAFMVAPVRPDLPTPAVWDYQREAVEIQGGGPASAYARWALGATAWAARTSIERQRDVFRYSAVETRLGEPAAAAVAAFRRAYRLPLQGTTMVALTALVFYGLLGRGAWRLPARPLTEGVRARRRPAGRPGATASGKVIDGKVIDGTATAGKGTAAKATTKTKTTAKAAGKAASSTTGAASGTATATRGNTRARATASGKPATGKPATGRAGGRKAPAGAAARDARPAADGWWPPANAWVIAVLLLLSGTLAVTKPQTVLAAAGAPGERIQAVSAAVLGLADPTRPPTTRQGTETTQRELAGRYWTGFVGAPLSRLQTGSRVLADAPPERKRGLLGALTSQIGVVRAWAAGARGLERIVIASFSLLYVLPFALLLWALAMAAAIAQALLFLLGLGTLVAAPLALEPRWRGAVRRWWLLPLLAAAALLALASLASLGTLRLAAVIRGIDEYIGMLLAGSLLPAAAVAVIARRARRQFQGRAGTGRQGGPDQLTGAPAGGPDQPDQSGRASEPAQPGAAAATAGKPGSGRSRGAAGRTALGGAA